MSELEILEYAYQFAKIEWKKASEYAFWHKESTDAADAESRAWKKMHDLRQLLEKKRAND